MKRSGIKRRRRTKHQEANVQHEDYRAWLATQPCCVCQHPGVQLAHVGLGGTGLKHGDDDQCIPMCFGCHADHDETKGRFARPFFIGKHDWRLMVRGHFDQVQVAVHRGRYEASQAEPRIGVILF